MITKTMLTYSIVIATKNRANALRLSVPRMVNQTRPPSQIIIIDSSENHNEVLSAINGLSLNKNLEVIVKHSAPSSSQQRNIGIDIVKHPIVFFPDDDSIWFDNTAELQMEAYESEYGHLLSAVCAAESKEGPPGFLKEGVQSYRMNYSDKLRQKISFRRAKLEKILFPDPFIILAHRFYPKYSLQEKFLNSIVPVEYMTGFRMGFRTEVIKEGKFETTFEGYCLNEDIDASLFAWTKGIVAAVNQAKVFHYKSPEQRSGGWKYGIDVILNKAFIISKYTKVNDGIRNYCLKYFRYKCLLYTMAAKDQFGKDRASGAKEASKEVKNLLKAEGPTVKEEYLRIKSHLKSIRK